MLEILDPGLLSTIQDAGRPETTDLGVPTSGGCDPVSLAVANLLVDADAGAAALEMTIVGPTINVLRTGVIAIAGADLGGRVRETGQPLTPGRTHLVARGTTLEFAGSPDPTRGARAYLALPGGIDVPAILGSASTCLVAGFGGIDGRALRSGDRLSPRSEPDPGAALAGRVWSPIADAEANGPTGGPVRLLDGPHLGLVGGSVLEALLATDWTVAAASDRVGIRLTGPALPGRRRSAAPNLLSHGVVWGAVQLPPDGDPIVLLADHQTTGGYPVIAVAIVADRPRLGQLRPGSPVRFERTDLDTARAALRRQQLALANGVAALRESRIWDELAGWTGA